MTFLVSVQLWAVIVAGIVAAGMCLHWIGAALDARSAPRCEICGARKPLGTTTRISADGWQSIRLCSDCFRDSNGFQPTERFE